MARTVRRNDYNENDKADRFARKTKHRQVRASARRGLAMMAQDLGMADGAVLPIPIRQRERTI
jgi:hypothetical protein